jgi:hypothetical protein
MGWPSAAAIWAGLVYFAQALGWLFTGILKEKQREAVEGEELLTKANQATNGVDSMSRAERLQYLASRGRLRNPPGDG